MFATREPFINPNPTSTVGLHRGLVIRLLTLIPEITTFLDLRPTSSHA